MDETLAVFILESNLSQARLSVGLNFLSFYSGFGDFAGRFSPIFRDHRLMSTVLHFLILILLREILSFGVSFLVIHIKSSGKLILKPLLHRRLVHTNNSSLLFLVGERLVALVLKIMLLFF